MEIIKTALEYVPDTSIAVGPQHSYYNNEFVTFRLNGHVNWMLDVMVSSDSLTAEVKAELIDYDIGFLILDENEDIIEEMLVTRLDFKVDCYCDRATGTATATLNEFYMNEDGVLEIS